MQRIAAADVEVGHAVQHEVHAGDRRSDIDELLPVETNSASVAAVAFYLGQARDEHAAGAAVRVVDGLARLGSSICAIRCTSVRLV